MNDLNNNQQQYDAGQFAPMQTAVNNGAPAEKKSKTLLFVIFIIAAVLVISGGILLTVVLTAPSDPLVGIYRLDIAATEEENKNDNIDADYWASYTQYDLELRDDKTFTVTYSDGKDTVQTSGTWKIGLALTLTVDGHSTVVGLSMNDYHDGKRIDKLSVLIPNDAVLILRR